MRSIGLIRRCDLPLLAFVIALVGALGCERPQRDCSSEESSCVRAQAILQSNIEQLRRENAALAEELRRARSSLAFEHSTEGFGKTTWGMNRAQVRRTYPEAEVQDPHTLIMDREIDSHPMRTYFKFSRNHLTKVHIAPTVNSYGVEGHEAIYQDMLKLLVRKYGPPRDQDQRARGDSARLEKKWETEKTLITLVFIKSGLEPVLQLDYVSKELSYVHEQSAAEREIEDL
jgi:hypothetical protein